MKIDIGRIVSVTALVISLYFLIRLPFFTGSVIAYLEMNFSADNQLNVFSRFFLRFGYGLMFVLATIYSVLVLTNTRKKLFAFFSKSGQRFLAVFLDIEKLKTFFLPENEPVNLSIWILVSSSIVGFFLHFTVLYFGLPAYEGLLEYISAIFVALGLIFLIIGLACIKQNLMSAAAKNTIRVVVSIILVVLIFYLGEELSWGQQIFKWQSTGIFQTHNYQQETNLHNFLNPIIGLFYPLVGLSSFLVLFLFWVFPSKTTGQVQKILIPPTGFFIIFLLMAGSGFYGPSEMFEALLSLGIFLYGVRFFVLLRK